MGNRVFHALRDGDSRLPFLLLSSFLDNQNLIALFNITYNYT